MNSLNNDFLSKAYEAAKRACRDNSLSGEDTVMHLEGRSEFSGHKWVRLGSRSDDFKARNEQMRKEFFKNLRLYFGSRANIDSLPKEMLEKLKLYDFKLNSEDESTSNRPLTARRIIAICEMADKWQPKERLIAEMAKLKKDRVLNGVPWTINVIFEEGLGNGTDIESLRTLVAFFKTVSQNLEVKCLNRVEEELKGRPVREQCIVYSRLMAAVDKAMTQQGLREKQENPGAQLADYENMINDVLNAFDYKKKITRDELNELKSRSAVVCRFLRAHLERKRNDYMREKGGINTELVGAAPGSKYDIIKVGIEIWEKIDDVDLRAYLKQSVGESNIFSAWYRAERDFLSKPRNAGKQFNDSKYVKKYLELMVRDESNDSKTRAREAYGKFKKLKVQYDKNTEKYKKAGELVPEFPSTLTSSGRNAHYRLEQMVDMSSHAESCTAQQMLDAYNIMFGIGDLFFKCLEKDRENGNTAMFDKFMQAMNAPGCIQYRSVAIQELKADIDLGIDLRVELASPKQKLCQGFGNKVNELYKQNGGKAVSYDSVVAGYLKAIGKSRQIKLEPKLFGNDHAAILDKYSVVDEETKEKKKDTVLVSEDFFQEAVVRNFLREFYEGYLS